MNTILPLALLLALFPLALVWKRSGERYRPAALLLAGALFVALAIMDRGRPYPALLFAVLAFSLAWRAHQARPRSGEQRS